MGAWCQWLGLLWNWLSAIFMLPLPMSWVVPWTIDHWLPFFPFPHPPLLKKVRNCAQNCSWISSSPFSPLTLVDLESLCPTLNPCCGYQQCLLKGWWEGLGKELLYDSHTGNLEYPFSPHIPVSEGHCDYSTSGSVLSWFLGLLCIVGICPQCHFTLVLNEIHPLLRWCILLFQNSNYSSWSSVTLNFICKTSVPPGMMWKILLSLCESFIGYVVKSWCPVHIRHYCYLPNKVE